jgi:hypothetical protein
MAYNLPRNYLSASQANLYLNCPQKFEREYVKGIRPDTPRSAALSTGSVVHKIVETHLLEVLAGGRESSETQLFSSIPLSSYYEDNVDLEDSSVQEWVLYAQNLYKTWYKGVGMSVMPTQSELRFESFVGDVPVLGFIDYVDNSTGKPEIVDLKVAKRSKSEADCRNSLQLAMYAITQKNPCVRFDTVVKTKIPKVGVARHTFTKSELGYYTDLIGEIATNISAGNFPMTSPTQWMCTPKWCGHYASCRGATRD